MRTTPLPERLSPKLRHEIEVGSVLRYEYEGRSVNRDARVQASDF
jgi:hypothetical protein